MVRRKRACENASLTILCPLKNLQSEAFKLKTFGKINHYDTI